MHSWHRTAMKIAFLLTVTMTLLCLFAVLPCVLCLISVVLSQGHQLHTPNTSNCSRKDEDSLGQALHPKAEGPLVTRHMHSAPVLHQALVLLRMVLGNPPSLFTACLQHGPDAKSVSTRPTGLNSFMQLKGAQDPTREAKLLAAMW